MGVWQNLYDNFKKTLDETTGLTSPLVQSNVNLNSIPSPSVNGAYFIYLKSIPSYELSANKVLDLDISVGIQIGYNININDYLNSYNNMVNDVELIIATRLDAEGFQSNILINLDSVDTPQAIGSEAYMIWELSFTVKGRRNLV